MANTFKEVNELMGYVDAILAMIDMYPSLNLDLSSLGDASDSLSVMGLLSQFLVKFFTKEEIIDFLVKMLIKVLPEIELAVKGVILSNLKLSTSCNVDPYIPSYWRQEWIGDELDPSDNLGVSGDPSIIPINYIDLWNKFNIDPTSELGQKYYAKTSILYQYSKIDEVIDMETRNTYLSDEDKKIIENRILSENTSRSRTQLEEILRDKYPTFNPNEDIVNIGDISNVYQLVRADDMDGFLWFVINKGLYTKVNRTDLKSYDDAEEKHAIAYSTARMQFPRNGSYEEINDENVLNNDSREFYLSGDIVSTVKSGINSINYLMSVNGEKINGTYTSTYESFDPTTGEVTGTTSEETNGIAYKSLLLPCSDRYNSFIWYMTDGNIFTRGLNDDTEKEDPALNLNERGLFSISYTDYQGNVNFNPFSNGCFRFKVLPKPMLHYRKGFWLANAEGSQMPFVSKKILFNWQGKPISLDKEFNKKKKGYFTVRPELNNGKIVNPFRGENDGVEECYYELLNNKGSKSKFRLNIRSDQSYDITVGEGSILNYESNSDDVLEFVNSCLFPCYPGLTIYEFNWDFVMNTRLLYPKVIAKRLIENLLNVGVNIGLNASLSMEETIYQQRISSIIEELMNNETGEINDCFFTFSNDKFTSMLHEAEKKRANLYPFEDDSRGNIRVNSDDIMNIIDDFKETATKHEQSEILTQAFTQATVSITDEVLPEDKTNIGINFLIGALKILGMAVFEAILSPKWLLLLEVNRRMSMGDPGTLVGSIKKYRNSPQEIIMEFSALITSIIAEIQKIILEETTAIIATKLKELTDKLSSMLVLEQITFYKELIIRLIKDCTFSFPLFGHRAELESSLDVVRYADIDPVDQPKTEEC